MINTFVIVAFAAAFSARYLAQDLGVVSVYFMLVPELLSAIAMLLFIAIAFARGGIVLDGRYAVFFALLLGAIVFGYVGEQVPMGPVVSGLRDYLKFLPFFLLPTVYDFSLRQLKTQFVFLLAILFLETPLAVHQRFVTYADSMHTGDPVVGTTSASSSLTILMICGIAALVVLYLRRRIGLPLLLMATAVLFLPTTLNETKGTLVLLPLATIVPALVLPAGSRIGKRLLPVVAIAGLAAASFVAVYDSLIAPNRTAGGTIGEFFVQGEVEEYLYTGIAEGEGTWIGRFDSIVIAVRQLSDSAWSTAFGLGAGNVSESKLPGFDGEYPEYYMRYGVGVTQVSKLLWEVGVVGLLGFLLVHAFILGNALKLARSDGEFAVIGQIWATITVIAIVCLVYKTISAFNEIGYPFWFYSGVVAAKAHALAAERRAARRGPALEPAARAAGVPSLQS